jgi:hypothetical protein
MNRFLTKADMEAETARMFRDYMEHRRSLRVMNETYGPGKQIGQKITVRLPTRYTAESSAALTDSTDHS